MVRKHEIISRIDLYTKRTVLQMQVLKQRDVAIEFTTPESALDNYLKCFENNIPVVSGTTGWLNKLDLIKKICSEEGQTFFTLLIQYWSKHFLK